MRRYKSSLNIDRSSSTSSDLLDGYSFPKNVYNQSGSMAKLDRRRQSSKREVVGSSPTVAKKTHFVISSRASQLNKAITNEIKRGIHLANTLF